MSAAAQPFRQELIAIHTIIPGRARFRFEALKGSKTLKHRLESMLPCVSGISDATASIRTGTILVHYDRRLGLPAVIDIIQKLLWRDRVAQHGIDNRSVGLSNWHLMQARQVLRRFRSSMLGLSGEVFEHRLRRHGPNRLPAIRRRKRHEILLGQFNSLPTLLLLGAAALSVVTGGAGDAVVILCVVALNAGIGYFTEEHAEKTISALSKRISYPVPIVRDGKKALTAVETAVLGDLLELRPGVVIAADARVVASEGLTTNEAMLTGESVPVTKTAECLDRRDIALVDRTNMVYAGTIVTGGSGFAVVVATGARSEIGNIQALIGNATTPTTPLQRQLGSLGHRLVWVAGGACGLVFLFGVIRGYGLLQNLKNAIALAVASVPEGLPALATTTLALGVDALRRRNVLVRSLEAVETLASVQVVCLDKTGTITENRMAIADVSCRDEHFRVVEGRLVDQRGNRVTLAGAPCLEKLAEIVVLCNETEIAHERGELNGSPTENALVQFALDLGLDIADLRSRRPTLDVMYRTERRLFMVTRHRVGTNCVLAAIKGSPEEVLALCGQFMQGHEAMPMSDADRQAVLRENSRLAGVGQRVLGVAYGYLRYEDDPTALPLGLTWVGLISMEDPLRRGINELVRVFRDAGIHPVIITGDQRGTAAAIARKLDLGNGNDIRVFDSAELEDFGVVPELSRVPHVFARVTPAEKLQIVRALQKANYVVAMTGDGVNDSPALKAADIGIAMGSSGSEAAREVAHIILQDDNLMSLAPAIEQGRRTYGNIQKAIRYLLSTNLSEVLVMLAAPALGLGQPLAPAHLLWINLISDVFPALALGLEPADPNSMRSPPRDPKGEIVGSKDFLSLGREASVICVAALATYAFGVRRYGVTPRSASMCFASLITAQLLHALSCRSRSRRAFGDGLPPNHVLSIVLATSFVLQAAAMFMGPLRSLLGIAPIGAADALVAVASGLVSFLANEALKYSAHSRASDIVYPKRPKFDVTGLEAIRGTPI